METHYRAETEKLIDKYKERILVVKSGIKSGQWNTNIEDTEIDVLETIIEDLQAMCRPENKLNYLK